MILCKEHWAGRQEFWDPSGLSLVTLNQQLPLSGPRLPQVQMRRLEQVVSQAPGGSDSQ